MSRFRGRILVQTRTVQTVGRAFAAPTPDAGEQQEILSLLGCIVLSGRSPLLLDGTIGSGDRDKASAALEQLGVSKEFEWVRPAPHLSLDAAHHALDVVTLAGPWQDTLEQPTSAADWRLARESPDAVTRWLRDVESVVTGLQNIVGKPQDARDLAVHLSSYDSLRGNKLLAALAMLEATADAGSVRLQQFLAAYERAAPDARYALLTALISAFRPPLLMSFSGFEGGIFAFSGSLDTVGRYKALLWQRILNMLAQEQRPPLPPSEETRSADDMWGDALTKIGLLVLDSTNQRAGRLALLQTAYELARNRDFPAMLRWIVDQKAGWRDGETLTESEIQDRLEEVGAQLRKDRFLGAHKRTGVLARSAEVVPDTVSETAKEVLANAIKDGFGSLGTPITSALGAAAGSAVGGAAGIALGALAAGATAGAALAIVKLVGGMLCEKGNYAAGISTLASSSVEHYDTRTIGDTFDRIWSRSLNPT